MQKRFLPSVLLASLFSLVALQGCKKENGLDVDNDKVVKTPYSLYAANDEGWLINSTDGEKYANIFPPDGYAPNLIVTSGNNLLFLKDNLHMSENNGRNFNPVFSNVRKFPWQTMAYDCPGQKRLYITSNTAKGISYSDDNGKTWKEDIAWEENLPPSFEVSSFSAIGNTTLFAYSNVNNVLFRRDNAGATWRPVTSEGLFPVSGTEFFLSSNANTLYLTDHNGLGGVWYSEDEGFHWFRVGQNALPLNHHWNCAASPTGGRSFLVGTDSMGVYRVDNGNFVSSTVGLEKNTSVYSMAVKRNIYKNDVTRNYVFIATNIGVFRSEDNGLTWDKMTYDAFEGSYIAVY